MYIYIYLYLHIYRYVSDDIDMSCIHQDISSCSTNPHKSPA